MISATISGKSIKRALRDVSRSHKRKSFRKNKVLLRKAARRFRKAARDSARDLAKPVARATGLTLSQAKRRVRYTKRISSRKIYSEVYTRGQALKVHAGRLKSVKVKRGKSNRGVYVKGKLVRGAFVTRETYGGKKELRRILVREQKKIKALTYGKKDIQKAYNREGPRILRRHSRLLMVEIGRMVRKA